MIDIDAILRDNPEAAKKQMENQRATMEMITQIKALLDKRADAIRDELKAGNAPEGGVIFVMLHNAKIITNMLAAHMLEHMAGGRTPGPKELEGFLAMCAHQAHADHEKFVRDKASAS